MQKMLRVLVAEDDVMIASLLSETIEDLGYRVCGIATTETEAVALAHTCQPNLMIVDAGLADGSGVAAVEAILQTRFVPHLFVTGDGRRVRALHPEAIILEKPFFIPELLQAIERALAKPADR